MHVFVIDSDESSRQTITSCLRDWGYETTESAVVREAIRRLESGHAPDLIISDIDFPQKNGGLLLKYVQSNPRLRRIPLIVCSEAADPLTVKKAISFGAREYMIKPIEPEALKTKVRVALDRAAGAVVVVEDDPLVRGLLAKIVRQAGFRVVAVENGRDAIHALDENRVAMVVTDLMMPEMDGIELTREIKSRQPDLPVLVVTGKRSTRKQHQATQAGADGYITKPFKNVEITHTITRLLGE